MSILMGDVTFKRNGCRGIRIPDAASIAASARSPLARAYAVGASIAPPKRRLRPA